MSSIRTPLLDSTDTKLCRSSRGVQSAGSRPALLVTSRNARRTFAASSASPVELANTIPSSCQIFARSRSRIVPATVELAGRLCVDEGDSLVSRSFLRLVDGEPASLQDSYYTTDIAQECGLITPHDIPQGTVRAMADRGHVEVGYVDEILTRMPSPDEVRKLGLGAGVPVLVYIRTTYTKQRPLRLTLTIFAGDRNRVVYELGDLDAYHREQPAP
jgi:DNA-binding GntR family transcriptional regulator